MSYSNTSSPNQVSSQHGSYVSLTVDEPCNQQVKKKYSIERYAGFKDDDFV